MNQGRRLSFWVPCLVFLSALYLYLPTLNPAFRADDSPETVAVSATLGIQHPPGYPLHTLLGRLSLALPLGSSAWRLSLLAASAAALAAALLAALVMAFVDGEKEIWTRRSAGLLAGLALAGAQGFWAQALTAKGGIYTVHLALMAATLLSLAWTLSAPEDQGLKGLRWTALWLGLGFAQHWETQLVLVPALAWILFARRQSLASLPRLWTALFFLLPGLLLYLYLPLRAAQNPLFNWGRPTTWDRFWWVFLRQEYLDVEAGFVKSLLSAVAGNTAWSEVGAAWAVVERQGWRVLGLASTSVAWFLLPFMGLGLWALLKRHRALGQGTLILAVSFPLIVTFYFHLREEMVWVLDAFLPPLYLTQALLAGLGLAYLLGQAPLRLAQALFLALALGLPLGLSAWRGPALSQADQYLAYDYGRDLMLSLRKDALFLSEGDFNTMPLYYLHGTLGQRRDVELVTTVFLSTDWGVEQIAVAQPHLGLKDLPAATTGPRQGDGALLRAALGQLVTRHYAQRPIQMPLFHEAMASTVPEWEPRWQPHGLAPVLALNQEAWEAGPALGLLQTFSTRSLLLDRLNLDDSPSLALANYAAAYLSLAERLQAMDRTVAAGPFYQRAVVFASRSNRAEALVHWGLALAQGTRSTPPNLPAAVDKFEQAIAFKPHFEAYADLAAARNDLGEKGRYPQQHIKAEEAAVLALKLKPEAALAWRSMAVACHYLGKPAPAQEAMRRAEALERAKVQP